MRFADEPVRPGYLLRDHDTKFVAEFDQLLEAEDAEVKAVRPVAPNLNAYAERWVRCIKSKCLYYFVVFGDAHLRHLVDCTPPITTNSAPTSPWATSPPRASRRRKPKPSPPAR